MRKKNKSAASLAEGKGGVSFQPGRVPKKEEWGIAIGSRASEYGTPES